MTIKNTSLAGKPADTLLQYPLNSIHRILVVEDDRDLRQINAMVLYHAGYHVDTAEDGASGWSALQASRYDVLITDNNMPGMTGLELIKKARFEKMPLSVILASGAAPTEELDRCPWLLDAMLLKPYTAEAMLDTVKNVLPLANDPAAAAQMSGSRDLEDDKISPVEKILRTPTSPGEEIAPSPDDDFARRIFGYTCQSAIRTSTGPQNGDLRL